MDYFNSTRVKIWGTGRVVENDPNLLEKLSDPTYPGRVERAILFTVEAWDMNCHQHIHKRYSESQVASVVEELQTRVRELETELAALKSAQNS